MGVIVGIDLGTTNSCVAIVRDGRPKVIEDERGYNILPSCIATKGKGRFVVGHAAKALMLTNPQDVLYAVKRLLGKKWNANEVQETSKRVAYDVVEGDNGNVLLRLGELEITPVEASSIILKAVKEIAERTIGEPVTDAVITVPAHFTHAQRKATMEAGEKAGLNVLRLLNEPTAAALAYGFKKDIQKKICVFDLGGGTFDVSVLEVGDGVYEILGTAGNTFLGGEDFDYRIVAWLSDIFRSRTGVDVRQDREALQRLRDAAERAKCELSFVDRTPILIPRLWGEENLEVELTREQLEGMVQDLVNECIKITDSALRTASVSIEDLDEIILVGGMTRMPKIQETIRVFFGMNPCKGVHPEEVVAVGAAVHGYSLESETQGTLLLDVTPLGLGIDVAGGFFKSIIEKNTTVPCSESRTFTTVRDGQRDVKVVVRQGESKLATDNELLGEFTLGGIREAEKMVPKIDVTFRVDSNGLLHVTAVDRDTGESQQITIRDYIEQATGQERKDIVLAKDEVRLPGSDGDKREDPQQKSLFGALASKLAGFGRKPKKEEKQAAAAGPARPAPDVTQDAPLPATHEITARHAEATALAERSADRLAVQTKGGPPAAPASRPAPSRRPAEPHDDAMAFGGDDDDELIPELDPTAVAPRSAQAPRGGSKSAPPPPAKASTPRSAPPKSEPARAAPRVAPVPELPDIDDDIAEELRRGLSSVPEDPFAVAERPRGRPAAAPMPDLPPLDDDLGLVEAPAERDADAFGIAPRGPQRPAPVAPMGAIDLDDIDLDNLDAFAVAPRGAASTARNEDRTAPSGRQSAEDRTAPGSKRGPFGAAAGEDRTAPGTQRGPIGIATSEDRTAPGSGRGPAGPKVAGEDRTAPGSNLGPAAKASEPSRPPPVKSEPAGQTPQNRTQAIAPLDDDDDDHTSPTGAETGSGRRRPARLRISYKKSSTFVGEYRRNLQRGGTFIKTKKPLDVGRDCILHLTVPGLDQPIEVRGSVVWSSKGQQLNPGQDEGMGIKYDAGDDDGMTRLRTAVDNLAT